MRRSKAGIWGVHKDKGHLPRRHLASLADSRLLAQLPMKREAENKRGKAPTHNLAADLLVADNMGRGNQRADNKRGKVPTHSLAGDLLVADNPAKGNQRAERKRARRVLQRPALGSTNLV
jgi:hypothetical protein